MFRRLSYVVSAICTVLLSGTVTLWTRSYSTADGVSLRYQGPGGGDPVVLVRLQGWRGIVWFTDERAMPPLRPGRWVFHSCRHAAIPVSYLASDEIFPLCFEWGWQNSWSSPVSWPVFRAGAPFWTLALLFLPGAAVGPWAYYRHRRWRQAGHCQRCGYDLTGNVSGRCPECGAAAQAGGRDAGKLRG